MKLIVSRAAAADVVRLRTFLAERDNRVAQRVTIALDTAVRSLKDFPERGRPSGLVGARDLNVPFGQSSYVLRYVYSAEADEIIILRIWHGRELRE